jgi:hypothetical protein
MRPTPLRTIADALVITAVVALALSVADRNWPPAAHFVLLLPAGYLFYRLSDDKNLPWWKPIGFLGLFFLLRYLSFGSPEERIMSPGYTLPIFFLAYLGFNRLKKCIN